MMEEEQEDGAAEATVLVAVMKDRRDWERVQAEGWYRVPAGRAPRQMAADYLAFYHTAAFAEEKWSVRHFAPILSVRVVRRRELLPSEASHPRADALYFRFGLGPLETLERPVFSRRLRRITFINTTLERLRCADDVSDLWLTPPLRERLWVELNRQGVHAEREFSDAPAADLFIPCRRGGVVVQCAPAQGDADAWREGDLALGGPPPAPFAGVWLRFEDVGWPVRLAPYVERIAQEVARLGGPA